MRAITETEPIEGAKVDWIGTAINFVAVASIIFGSMLGGRYGWWLARRPQIVGGSQFNPLGLSSAPLLVAFGMIVFAILLSRLNRNEEKGGQPLFSMKRYDNRTFLIASLMATVFFLMNGALPFTVLVSLQQAVGFDGLQTAVTMMSLSVGSIILGFASGSLVQRIQPRTLMQIFLVIVAVGMVWLFATVNRNGTQGQLFLPMFVIGCGIGVISSQLLNIQMSALSPQLQGQGSGFAETGKELGIGLETAIVGSIMFSMAIGGFVDSVARQADIPLTPEERAATILLIEDEAVPDIAINTISQRVPSLEQVGKEAFVEGFQTAMGALVGVVLVALLAASSIPKVNPAEVIAAEVQETVDDVSSKRL